MTGKTNERLTKQFVHDAVEAGMDSQRQYAESLFHNADKRVQLMIEQKLKAALATIRPETVPEETTKMPMPQKQNAECLEVLTRRMVNLALQYELATGLRVRSVAFETVRGHLFARPLVYNP